MRNSSIIIFHLSKQTKTQVLHTVWCYISGWGCRGDLKLTTLEWRSLLGITQGLKLGKRPATSAVWRWYLSSLQSWSKVCGTPWKLARFSSSPLVWCWKRLFSPNLALPPPSIQCCFKGDTLSTLIQHCMGGMVKLSVNGKCTMTLDQDCSHNFVAAREVLVTRATQLVTVWVEGLNTVCSVVDCSSSCYLGHHPSWIKCMILNSAFSAQLMQENSGMPWKVWVSKWARSQWSRW